MSGNLLDMSSVQQMVARRTVLREGRYLSVIRSACVMISRGILLKTQNHGGPRKITIRGEGPLIRVFLGGSEPILQMLSKQSITGLPARCTMALATAERLQPMRPNSSAGSILRGHSDRMLGRRVVTTQAVNTPANSNRTQEGVELVIARQLLPTLMSRGLSRSPDTGSMSTSTRPWTSVRGGQKDSNE